MPIDVSVIIATYNVEAYIERAIESALNQHGLNVEIVVADDASTDRTMAIVRGITDPRVKTIQLPANGGPSVARNAAFAKATGTWLAILDGDDHFLPGRLSECLKTANKVKAQVVIDNLTVFKEADGSSRQMYSDRFFSQLTTLSLETFIANNRSFLGGGISLGYVKPIFLADFLRRHNLKYDPQIRIGEDYMLLCEALANGANCAVVHQAGYVYTARAGSISHRLTSEDVVRIARGDEKFTRRHTLAPAAARAQKRREIGLAEAYSFTRLIQALKQHDFSSSLRIILEHPRAARNLWRPLYAKAMRFVGRF
jgi:succinoglycan biosynthesis protein ExoO